MSLGVGGPLNRFRPVSSLRRAEHQQREFNMSKSTGFDLASIDTIAACNKPQEIEIKHPVSGEGTGVFFAIVGKDSDIYRTRIKALADENIRRDHFAQQRGKAEIPTIERLERKNIDTLVAVTTGWRNVVLNGEALDFTADNARKIYTAILPVREQVQEAVNDLENFMKG